MKFFSYSKFIDPLLKDVRIAILNFAEVKKGERILDVGCGTGDQATYFSRVGAIVAGIDISPQMISQAIRKKRKENLDIFFQGADATNLPFLEPVFDVALISLVLHEVENKKRDLIIQEMKRVVKRGGRLIFVDFNSPLPVNFSSFLVKSIEFLAGRDHWQNFKSYHQEGGLLKLVERNDILPEKIEYFKKGLLLAIRAKNI